MDSVISHAILRPTVIYGLEDILINNIAWFLRRFPVFGIPGDGQYGVRPIYVEDMARLMAADTLRKWRATTQFPPRKISSVSVRRAQRASLRGRARNNSRT
jgi:hypothetical protein